MINIEAEMRAIVIERLNEQQALAILAAAGYRISKPKARKAKVELEAPALNAVGKPYGANFDPNYRMRHKPSRPCAKVSLSTAGMAHAKTIYRGCIEAKHKGNAELIAEICERNGV